MTKNTDKVFDMEFSKSTKEIIDEDEEVPDYLEECIGPFGRWQAQVCFIAASTRLIAMWNIFSIIFLTPSTVISCEEYTELNLNQYLDNNTDSVCRDECARYEYYSDIFNKTLISDFGLICDDAWLASFTQTIVMFGVLMGVFLFGWISDRHGRRIALLISCFVNIAFMVAAPFAPTYLIFNCLRFVIGVASGGIMVISIVVVLENVGSKYREIAGCSTVIPDGIAEASLALFAYFSTSWQMYLLAISVVAIIFVFQVLLMPETPRWLLANGRVEEAIDVVTAAAKRNKLSTIDIRDNLMRHTKFVPIEVSKSTYLDLFRSWNICLRTVFSFFIWFAVGLIYYGISQYVTFVGSNIYVATAILGLIQIPANPLGMILNKTIGRRLSTMFSMIATGLCMIVLTLTTKGHIATTIVGIIGMIGATVSFAVIYVYVSELFPTPIRNMAYGMCSAGAKLGAMVAPFIANASPQWVPSVIFAVFPVVASLSCLILPETKGQALQDSAR